MSGRHESSLTQPNLSTQSASLLRDCVSFGAVSMVRKKFLSFLWHFSASHWKALSLTVSHPKWSRRRVVFLHNRRSRGSHHRLSVKEAIFGLAKELTKLVWWIFMQMVPSLDSAAMLTARRIISRSISFWLTDDFECLRLRACWCEPTNYCQLFCSVCTRRIFLSCFFRTLECRLNHLSCPRLQGECLLLFCFRVLCCTSAGKR